MRKNIYFFSLIVSLLFYPFFFCRPAFAESSPASGSFLVRPWAVGQSVKFQTKFLKDGNLTYSETTTYSIVGDEMVNGKNYFWVEIESVRPDGVTSIKKIQVRQPGPIDFENVLNGNLLTGHLNVLNPRRRIQKNTLTGLRKFSSANEFEVPSDSVSQIENGPAPSESKDLTSQYDAMPNQSVRLKAGIFNATFFKKKYPAQPIITPSTRFVAEVNPSVSQSSVAWGTPEIPIWGIAKTTEKAVSNDKSVFVQDTELISYGSAGAVSKVRKTARLISVDQQKHMSEVFSESHPSLFKKRENP